MKHCLIVTALTVGLIKPVFCHASVTPHLEVISVNQPLTLDTSRQLMVRAWLQQLMISALYRDVIQPSSSQEWRRQLASPSRILCRYSAAATLAIPERPTLTFDEVLLPLPTDQYPGHIFIKRGGDVRRVAKYDPWVLHKLVSESGLSLYESLSGLERGLF